jgi:hypothetical protein
MAAAYCVARVGIQETRAWERPLRYVADDNQGNVGIIEFSEDGLVGAASARAPRRDFDMDRSILSAPSRRQAALRRVCELPLLNEGAGVSAVFWTSEDVIELPEPWESAYQAGMDVFRRELLSDVDWREVSAEYYGMSLEVSRLIVGVARRSEVRVPLVDLAESELRPLIPDDSQYVEDARDMLLLEGLFGVPHS